MIGAGMFIAFVSLRKLGLDDSGPASALLLLGALSGAYVGGTLLKGKSGWCSSICPLLPVQRLYGQTPYKLVANSHCTPCVGCTKNCYDFNPKVAFLADLKDPDPYWSGYKKLFAAAFPGLVVGFFNLPEARSGEEIARLYGELALYLAASTAIFYALDSLLKVSTHKLTTLWAAAAFSLFYWYASAPWPEWATWGARALAIALAAGWVLRTYAKERAFERQQRAGARGQAARRPRRGPLDGLPPRAQRRRAGGLLRAGGQARRRQAGDDAARGRGGGRAADRVGLPDGRLRRRPRLRVRRHGEPLGDLRRRALHAGPPRLRRQHPDGVLRARPGPGDDEAHPGEAGQAVALPDRAVHLRQVRRARGRARQRDRRRDGRRPRPPPPSARPDRPGRARSRTTSTTAWASRG